MEASRFGFNLPPSYKFDPTDADIVAHYLLPRAAGVPSPHAHAVIDADLYSCPPWELMERHGHAETDQALFFGAPRDPDDPKKRTERTVAAGEDGGVGGTWDGQKSGITKLVLLRGGNGGAAGEVVITYKRHHLSYYHGADDDGGGDGRKKKRKISTSGWVMYDYQIVDPQHLSGIVLSRVKITDRTKKKTKTLGKRKHHLVLSPGPHQAGPTNYYAPPGPDQPGPSNYYPAPGPDEAGPSNYYEPPPPVTGGEEYGGFTGGCFVGGDNSNYMYDGYGGYLDQYQQGDGSSGGGGFVAGEFMGETTGGSYVDGSDDYLNPGQQGDGGGGAAGDFMGETTGGPYVDGFVAGDIMGETTGGSCVDGNDDFLNLDLDFCSYFNVDDDFCFDFGDKSGFACPDGSNGCSEDEEQ